MTFDDSFELDSVHAVREIDLCERGSRYPAKPSRMTLTESKEGVRVSMWIKNYPEFLRTFTYNSYINKTKISQTSENFNSHIVDSSLSVRLISIIEINGTDRDITPIWEFLTSPFLCTFNVCARSRQA